MDSNPITVEEPAHEVAVRLAEIERSLERYGCFDLTEEDVAWLITQVRASLGAARLAS